MLATTMVLASAAMGYHRIASPLGTGGVETMELFDNTNCQGDPIDMMGLDAEGMLGGVGQCFAMKTGGGVKVEYLDGSCVDFEKPMMTATLYANSQCEGVANGKVHLMEGHCVAVKGASIQYTSPLSNIDYCTYADLVKEMAKSEVSVKVWMPSDRCEGPPVKEVRQQTLGTRSQVDCAGCCFVPGGDGMPDAYTQTHITCNSFGHIMFSMRSYKDDKCSAYFAEHPVNKVTGGKPFILRECNSAYLEELSTTMSTRFEFTNPRVSPLFCSVVEIMSRNKLPLFQGTFLTERDFNKTLEN